MTDRERLVEIIKATPHGMQTLGDVIDSLYIENVMVEHLLENGVIVPPCKVGQTVYIIHQGEIISGTVRLIRPFISENEIIYKGNVACMINIFYDAIKEPHEFYVVFENPCGIERIAYLSREEAEKAMKGGDEG